MSWIDHYRTNKNAVWIRYTLSDGVEYYLDSPKLWKNIAERIGDKKVIKFVLQYRSHAVDVNIDGEQIYVASSLKGQGDQCIYSITVGFLRNGKVYKQAYQIPELVPLFSNVSDIDQCFQECFAPCQNVEQKKANTET